MGEEEKRSVVDNLFNNASFPGQDAFNDLTERHSGMNYDAD